MNREYKIEIAERYASRGQFNSAIETIKQVLADDPNDALPHGLLAKYLISILRLHGARYELQVALGLDPMLPFLHVLKARIELLENNPKKAIESCEQAMRLEPHYVEALLLKSDLLLQLEQTEEALKCIEEAANIEPDNVNVTTAFGEYYFDLGQNSKAFSYAHSALNNAPEDENANILMGCIRLKQGDIEEAEYHAKFVILNNPDSRAALNLFANIKIRHNIFLGMWWKFNNWAAKLSNIKMGLVLIIGFLTFNLVSQILYDLGYKGTSTVVSYTWLALVLYSWVGIPMYYKALKKELNKFQFNENF